MRLALLFLLAVPAAAAQTPAETAPAETAPPAEAVPVDSTAAQAAADSTAEVQAQIEGVALRGLFQRAVQAEQQARQPTALLRAVVAQSTQPTTHAFGTGLQVTLPAGWDGPSSAVEAGLPGYALYTFQNAAPGHPLYGVLVRVEQVAGLNQLLRERWRRGQTPHGYHGTAPVGPATAPLAGFAVEVAGPGQAGIVVFAERADALWAVQVVAPPAVWTSRRDDVRALLAAVRLP